MPRLRSGSGTSRTTATSDSGDLEGHNGVGQSSLTASSSPSRPSTGSSSLFFSHARTGHHATPSSSSSLNPKNGLLAPGAASHGPSALSPVASRMRERDADAMERYLLRNRSGSASTDNKSMNGSTNGSSQASVVAPPRLDDFQSSVDHLSGSMTPRRLRPSFSAAQLRTPNESTAPSSNHSTPHAESRNRSGTNPSARNGTGGSLLSRSSSISNSLRSIISPDRTTYDDPQSYIGPPSQYASFPDPPLVEENATPTVNSSRRKALHILGKPLSGFDSSGSSHRRGMSATSVRGS
jgi:hypothetical protein